MKYQQMKQTEKVKEKKYGISGCCSMFVDKNTHTHDLQIYPQQQQKHWKHNSGVDELFVLHFNRLDMFRISIWLFKQLAEKKWLEMGKQQQTP